MGEKTKWELEIEKCVKLPVGGHHDVSVYPPKCLKFKCRVHRWKDGWWALWTDPQKKNNLGREFATKEELRDWYLQKNLDAGRVIAF